MSEDGREAEDRRCRLLVRLDGPPAPEVAAALAELLVADRLAAIVAPATADVAAFARTLPTALLAPDVTGEADGAVLGGGEDAVAAVEWLRREQGADAILVVDVGVSRHAAMEAGEAGADAILFTGDVEAVRDCVAWWSELFVLPVAAPVGAGGVAGPIAAGADFLLIEGADLVSDERSLAAVLEAVAEAEARRPPLPPAR